MSFSLFPAIFDRPANIRYSEQEPDEQIEILLRRHWFTNISWLVIAVIGIILPLFVPFFDRLFFHILPQLPADLVIALVVLWYMLIMAYILENFLYWYFNIYIITNLHLVDISMNSLLSKTVIGILLDDVQSAKTHVAGIFGSLFNFGNIIIETAAKGQSIQFLLIPNPDFVAERIQDLQENVEPGGLSDVS